MSENTSDQLVIDGEYWSVEQLNALTEPLHVKGDLDLRYFDHPIRVASIGGRVNFRGYTHSLPDLISIGENAFMDEKTGSLPALVSIGGALSCRGCKHDFDSLTKIGGPALFKDFEGSCPSLRSIGGDATFDKSPGDFSSLENIGGNAELGSVRRQYKSNTGPLPSLKKIGGRVILVGYEYPLDKLESIGGGRQPCEINNYHQPFSKALYSSVTPIPDLGAKILAELKLKENVFTKADHRLLDRSFNSSDSEYDMHAYYAVFMAGEEGNFLYKKYGLKMAAALIYASSRGDGTYPSRNMEDYIYHGSSNWEFWFGRSDTMKEIYKFAEVKTHTENLKIGVKSFFEQAKEAFAKLRKPETKDESKVFVESDLVVKPSIKDSTVSPPRMS
jgi:hypothetical protein